MSNKMNALVLHLVTLLKSYLPTVKREEGQGMVEYALIIVLVAIGLVAALGLLGDDITAAFQSIGDGLEPVTAP